MANSTPNGLTLPRRQGTDSMQATAASEQGKQKKANKKVQIAEEADPISLLSKLCLQNAQQIDSRCTGTRQDLVRGSEGEQGAWIRNPSHPQVPGVPTWVGNHGGHLNLKGPPSATAAKGGFGRDETTEHIEPRHKLSSILQNQQGPVKGHRKK
eukprot:TRINITY_DN26477_c0_g1_i1.p1 TRINITY_DN26477_c0_g1~~TRINITY_DN26477_c0_g1_i1.p1  ORF type:complete len:154 (-),score=24.93 TRINITY_DN26477_c0_g1_i1:330-791(-)